MKTKEGRRFYFDPALKRFNGTPAISGCNYIDRIDFIGYCPVCEKDTPQIQFVKTLVNGNDIKAFCKMCRSQLVGWVNDGS